MPPESAPESAPASAPAPESTSGRDLQRQRRLIAARAAHWRQTRRLTFALLALWLVTCFCTVFFARELADVTVFGWPLSFYMAAQGAALICLAIIGAYAWRMRQLDRAYGRALEGALQGNPGVDR
jgi:putative solute:sodium symporter small subunit